MEIVRYLFTCTFNSLLILFLLFSCASTIQAAVVINEFLPNPSGPQSEDTEWIELFNSGSDAIDLSLWQLDDSDGGSSPYTIASGSSIAANSFLVFEKASTNIALNNLDDSVRLFNPGGSAIDVHSYSGTSEDVSIGRTSNGGGLWVTCLSPTKGSSNNCNPPTPTKTPTPTKSPTSAPQTTPTPTPVQVISHTETPTTKKTPAKTPTPRRAPTLVASPSGLVLGLESITASQVATPSPGHSNILPLVFALLLIAVGLAIIAGVLIWKKRINKL